MNLGNDHFRWLIDIDGQRFGRDFECGKLALHHAGFHIMSFTLIDPCLNDRRIAGEINKKHGGD